LIPGDLAIDSFFLNVTNDTGDDLGKVDLRLGTLGTDGEFVSSSLATFSPLIPASAGGAFPDLVTTAEDPSHRRFTTSGWAPASESGVIVFSFALDIDDALVGQPLAIQWQAAPVPEPASGGVLLAGLILAARRPHRH